MQLWKHKAPQKDPKTGQPEDKTQLHRMADFWENPAGDQIAFVTFEGLDGEQTR